MKSKMMGPIVVQKGGKNEVKNAAKGGVFSWAGSKGKQQT